MVRLCLLPAVVALGSLCPQTSRMWLGRGSGGQEWSWQRGELTTVGCLGIKTATKSVVFVEQEQGQSRGNKHVCQ